MQCVGAERDLGSRREEKVPVGAESERVLREEDRRRNGRRASVLGGCFDSPERAAINGVGKVAPHDEISAAAVDIEAEQTNVRRSGGKLESRGTGGVIGKSSEIVERFGLNAPTRQGSLPGCAIRKDFDRFRVCGLRGEDDQGNGPSDPRIGLPGSGERVRRHSSNP